MGKLIAVVNNGTSPIYVGDQVVVPGNCRHFDEDLVPLHLRPAVVEAAAEIAVAPPPADPLAAELGCEPEQLLDAIAAVADVGQIMKLAELELASATPREGVLDALGDRQMAIAEEVQRQRDEEAAGQRAEAEAKAKADAEAKAARGARRS